MLKKPFYNKPTIEVAKNLLGKYLVHEIDGTKYVGKIVETEAYLEDDPASHTFNGKTHRNKAMYDEPGTAYVYFTYGMYHCFNVVTGKKGKGEAVLIRALEPIEGIEEMKINRNKDRLKDLCSGPAKLCKAFKIDKNQNHVSLLSKNFFIEKRGNIKLEIIETTRIGITKGKEKNYRFYIKDNKFISRN